jgi:hypothetical protein
MNLFCIFLLFLSFVGGSKLAFAQEGKSPRVLVLIIASDNNACYVAEHEIWRSYMHSMPENIEAYFIKANPELQEEVFFQGDVIWSRSIEEYSPGILNKTIMSMNAFRDRLDEFDYVLRTNLSSFYLFHNLVEFLKNEPTSNYYSGIIYTLDVPFVSGDGIVLSKDLVLKMINNMSYFMDSKVPDDLLIGRFFIENGIKAVQPKKRLDLLSLDLWNFHKDRIPLDTYQFRVKNSNDFLRETDELFIQRELVKKFY